MIPQDDVYPEVMEKAIGAVLSFGTAAGRAVLDEIAYAVQPIPSRPGVSKPLAAKVFCRDGFICRYCGGRTALTAVMEVLASIYPDIFPFHPNWKGGLTHPAIITRSAVVDHVDPGAWGGAWLDESNLVTACWPCNARKGDLTLAQLGWSKRHIEKADDWDGLTGSYPALWQAADRPNPRHHMGWMRCLGVAVPK